MMLIMMTDVDESFTGLNDDESDDVRAAAAEALLPMVAVGSIDDNLYSRGSYQLES